MTSPIISRTHAFLDSLDPATRTQFEAQSIADSTRLWGVELTLADNINMCLGAKYVSAVDSFSDAERDRIVNVMKSRGAPDEVCKYVAEFDMKEITTDHVVEPFGQTPAHAKYLVLGALVVAAADGISDKEMALILELGTRLNLSEALVHAFAADAKLTTDAERRGDTEALNHLLAIKKALFSLS